MELVEGETLSARLARGALPLGEALDVAKQVAAALEAAHEKGIVHRDLKPGNVMLRPDGTVKVLDFGLAKAGAAEGAASGVDLSHSPTMTRAATEAGVILGTAAYMSPEQARGKPVDKRTDVWSFGVVLFECLTGRPLFRGETVSDLIAKILEREPDWSALPRETPTRLRDLLHRCLRKDARERLRDIGDARLELSEAVTPAPDSPALARRAPAWAWPLAVAVALAAGLAAGRLLRGPARPSGPLLRFSIPAGQLKGAPRLSPDGLKVVYPAGTRLVIRDLQRFESAELPGTEGATDPFWSPDGSQIGFARDGKIWIASLAGSSVTALCPIRPGGGFNGGTWGKDGKIVYAGFRGGLYEVPVRGGEQRLVLAPEPTEVDFHWPDRLRDEGRVVLVAHRKAGPRPVAIVTLRDGSRKNLREFEGLGNAVYSATGHLLLSFVEGRQQTTAVPFSDSKMEITGEPFVVATGGHGPSISADGARITYVAGASRSLRELVFLNRDGRAERVVGSPQLGLDFPALSPDGSSVAVVAFEKENADLWIQDLVRGTRRRLVASPRNELFPSWSRDGRRLVYGAGGDVEPDLMDVPVDGSAEPRPIGATGFWPLWTPGGESVVFQRDFSGQGVLWRLDVAAGAKPVRLTASQTINEDGPTLSPDGKWLASMSDESGANQVFVRRLTDGSLKQQVSLAGGTFPFWSPDGKTIYYWEGQTLIEVAIGAGEALTFGEPRRLFSAADADVALATFLSNRPAVVAAGNGRFLAVRRAPADPYSGILLVENWLEEFRTR
jgi:serine/threonine-protein kinase